MPPEPMLNASFPPTRRTLIARVRDDGTPDEERQQAMEELLGQYRNPLCAYCRACCNVATHQIEDLVQSFIAHFLEKKSYRMFDSAKGRFRSWLRVCARNFWNDHRPTCLKPLPPDIEPTDDSAERAYRQAWRRQVLSNALTIVEKECESQGKIAYFRVFDTYYCDESEQSPTWEAIAEMYGLRDAKEASHRADWVRGKLRRAIRQVIRDYVDTEDDVIEELRDLLVGG